MAPTAKKPKFRTISDLKVGEKLVDIHLKVLCFEFRQKIPTKYGERELFIMVLADGTNFVQLTAWGIQASSAFAEFSDNSKGKFYSFAGLECAKANPNYNFGDVDYELQWRDGSDAHVGTASNDKMQSVTIGTYYAFLLQKMSIDANKKFDPTTLGNVKQGATGPLDFELQIAKLSPLNIVEARGQKSKVVDVDLLDTADGRKATLTAWGIYTEFVQHVFSGREGNTLRIRTGVKNSAYNNNFSFTFNAMSRFALLERATPHETPTMLAHLTELAGIVKTNIRLQVGRVPSLYDRILRHDETIVHDGRHKAEFFFTSSVKLTVGMEIVLDCVTVSAVRETGILSLTVHDEKNLTVMDDKKLKDVTITEAEYPPFSH